MSTEPWGAYLPEINAGRQETGIGPATWLASGAMWTDLASLVGEAMAAMTSELAAVGINWQGLAPTAMAASVGPFMSWLATMEATAAANALSCFAVAEAWGVSAGAMIPLPAVNTNRISEAIAEATNFLGVNSGIILSLNANYSQFWGNNGSVMMAYDDAVQLATMPKPASPPPPLANAAGAGSQITQATAMAAAQQALGSGTDAATQAMGQGASGATQGASESSSAASSMPQQMMQTMLGSAGQMMSAPTQMLGQFTQPLQSLTQPLQSLLGGMGGNTSDAAGFGIGPSTASSFLGVGGDATSGGAGMGGGGGGGMGLGGGMGGSMLNQTYGGSGATTVSAKSPQVFSGVSGKPADVSLASFSGGGGGAGGAGGGGGMAPMMNGAGHSGGASSRPARGSDPVIAVSETKDQQT